MCCLLGARIGFNCKRLVEKLQHEGFVAYRTRVGGPGVGIYELGEGNDETKEVIKVGGELKQLGQTKGWVYVV